MEGDSAYVGSEKQVLRYEQWPRDLSVWGRMISRKWIYEREVVEQRRDLS